MPEGFSTQSRVYAGLETCGNNNPCLQSGRHRNWIDHELRRQRLTGLTAFGRKPGRS
jgi:hypothetical protein